MSSTLVFKPIDVVFDSSDSVRATFGGTPDNPQYIITPDLTDVVGMSLLWVNVPYTYNVVDDTNNKISLLIGSTTYVLALDPGTYTSTNIV